ncbi:uncharacterized protein [Halyomorpha halys]|uniref:uncharacterized protein n=1 Tax=Halyomorpha halys TaxID=286706 RepID=UPI0034D241CA
MREEEVEDSCCQDSSHTLKGNDRQEPPYYSQDTRRSDTTQRALSLGRLLSTQDKRESLADLPENLQACISENPNRWKRILREEIDVLSKGKLKKEDKKENSKVTFRDHSSVNQFKYLRSLVTDDNKVESEIEARIAAGNRRYFSLQKILNFRVLSKRMRVAIYKTTVRPVVIHGGEALHKKSRTDSKLLGEKVIWVEISENGFWRRRRIEELINLYWEPRIVALIKRARIRWLGHVERMPDERIPKTMIYGKPDGKRKRGRPRIR